MKVLSIFGIIVSVMIFCVIAIGYFTEPLDHKVAEEVDAPTEVCWNYFTKAHRMDEWLTNFKKIEIVKGLPNKPGSIFKVIFDSDGKDEVFTQTVVAFKKGEIFTFDMENEVMFGHTEISFITMDGKTTIIHRQIVHGKNALYHFIMLLNSDNIVERQKNDLHRLRTFIESEYKN